MKRLGVLIMILFAGQQGVCAAEAHRETFGQLGDRPVEAALLSNKAGISVRIVAYGAAIQSLEVPDRDGKKTDIVLSYPDMAGFLAHPNYYGVTAGRYANRIAKGKFSLDGKTYQLPINDGVNTLHGGGTGFDKVLWALAEVTAGGSEASASFTYTSPDGDQGFPGALSVRVTFALSDEGALAIRYQATTSKPTVVNLTNHSYFNLSGAASGRNVLDQQLTLFADHYTPAGPGLIPTGEIRPVAGSAFDFKTPHAIGERIRDGAEPQLALAHGYDHNFVLTGGASATPKLAARVTDPFSGRVMEVLTTEPGLQVYSGNFLDGTVAGKEGVLYRQADALCLETQHFPDSPNQPGFPSTRLDPGQVYRQETIYRFSTSPR